MLLLRIVKTLLKHGADPNARDEFTNVSAMARKLSMSPLQVLEQRESEFSARLNGRATFKGFRPLHYAALADNAPLVALLVAGGADPAAESDGGHRAREYCASEGSRQILLEAENKVSWFGGNVKGFWGQFKVNVNLMNYANKLSCHESNRYIFNYLKNSTSKLIKFIL